MKTLADLSIGQQATIYGFQKIAQDTQSRMCRFIELGLQIGEKVTLCYRSPFGGYPLAVEINQQLIGLGFEESSQILVTLEGHLSL